MPSQKSPFRRHRFFIIFTLIALLHGYIGWRLLPELAMNTASWFIGIDYLCISVLLIPLGMTARFMISRPVLADRLSWVGSLLLGLFSSLLVLTLLRDVVLLFSLSAILASESALFVLVLAILVTIIGFINARRIPRVVEVMVPIDGLPSPLHHFRIVQISDLHIGPTIKRAYVEAVVKRVNALQPDLIAVTGDLVDGKLDQLASHTAPLAMMQAKHGVYVVTGNHEYYSGADQWMAEFRRLGMHTLSNEHVVIEHHGAQMVVAGVTDFNAGRFDVHQRSDPAQAILGAPEQWVPKILLAHQPRSATKAEAAGFDLQLSGHTHGGQFWPWNLFVPLQQPFTAGLHRMGHLWVYTSRGTGYWGPPKRFGAPSEISLIQLVPGN
jgi:predicted MPP superfamily phosphohydrolase